MLKYQDFIEACENGDLHTVEEYIDGGYDIPTNSSAIVIASEYGRPDVLKLLLDSNKFRISVNDYMCLDRACQWGRLDVVKLLVSNGAKVNNKWHILSTAVVSGQDDLFEFLLLFTNIDVHVGSDEAIQRAVSRGYFEMTKLLLEFGADVHCSNDYLFAMAHRDKKMLELLNRYK
jgi:ankyrin repeat protein